MAISLIFLLLVQKSLCVPVTSTLCSNIILAAKGESGIQNLLSVQSGKRDLQTHTQEKWERVMPHCDV